MKNSILLILLLFIAPSLKAQTQKKIALVSHSLKWKGSAVGYAYTPSGTLKVSEGSITLKGEEIVASSIVVDMSSLETKEEDLIKHLKSKDFFHVKKFPTATYQLISASTNEDGSNSVVGNMTIKNVTKEINGSLKVERNEDGYILSGKWKLDRTDFGVIYNSPSFFESLKDYAIADEIELEFEFVFN